MSDDDPFADFDSEPEDLERTIIMPAPGGRRRPQGEAAAPTRPPVRPGGPTPVVESTAKNPLIRAAATAVALVRRLRDTARHDDVPGLRDSVLATIKEFETKARALGAESEATYAARYALCALIDETVLSTPWGSQSTWTTESLLGTLHNETKGGAKFFQILERMSESPARNIDLLEFLYLCLSLGFQGKFAVMDRGSAQLEEIAHDLYRTIRNQRGEGERELSPHWRGVTDRRPAVARYVPLWVVPVAVCTLAAVLYLGFSYSINESSDAVFAELNALGREAAQLQRLPEPSEPLVIQTTASDEPLPPRPVERIRSQLEREITQGLVDVFDLGYATNIVVHNKGLFASGSSRVSNDFRPIIGKIGEVLKNEPGLLLVTGHTDSQPIRTIKFPSNWHLSSARANAVMVLLAESITEPGKLVSEGRADTEPIASNDTADGRQQNRRIEIKVPVN
jgi:type VI secretion system protein ImpK